MPYTTGMANTTRPRSHDLGPGERAVYELAELGTLRAVHAPLYRRQIAALTKAGLLTRDGDRIVPTHPRGPASAPPPALTPEAPPAPPPMETLVVRVPVEVVEAIEAEIREGETRSDAARRVIARGLGSGTRRAQRAG